MHISRSHQRLCSYVQEKGVFHLVIVQCYKKKAEEEVFLSRNEILKLIYFY